MTIIDPADFRRRIIEPSDFVADTEAFVDVRIERSKGKASYSFIGPGVSQNAAQKINLPLPHGFNVGGASMPHGVVNNPHLHYTAEVFICTRGSFQITVGRNEEQTIDLAPGDVFAAPPWIFRGFTNTGPDDGWMFVVLGGDDTGGIIWSPDVLVEAAETGLKLGSDNSLIDERAGDDATHALQPVSDEALRSIDSYTDTGLAAHLVRADDRRWSDRALLSSVVAGHASAVAPVLGHGMSEDRRHRPPVLTAQGFSIEWLRVEPGCSTGVHRSGEPQVLFLTEGAWQISCNTDGNELEAKPATGSIVSVPAGAWRNFTNVGPAPSVMAVVNGTDNANAIEWHSDIVAAAAEAGWGLDANRKIADRRLLPGGNS
jgi:quercetin dioxygenase-like cupin family protein